MKSERVCGHSKAEHEIKGGYRPYGYCNFQHDLCGCKEYRPRPVPEASPPPRAEALARRFHETYERLAPSFGYETRKASAVPWEDVPESNRELMIAVAAELMNFELTADEWEERLAVIYCAADSVTVARLCDRWDPSGGLLGRVREYARKIVEG